MDLQSNIKNRGPSAGNKPANFPEEIHWYPWNAAAFEKAGSEKKPILLSISGSWCHWCHVMDDTTYNDRSIIESINKNFIPIRVDTDRRPDINARYNMGGWPTTAFLTPEGEIIAGDTYIPPEQMRETLQGVYQIYHKNPKGIKERQVEQGRDEVGQTRPPQKMTTEKRETGRETETFADLIGFASSQVKKSYDKKYGGFGGAPKFPMVDALELAQLAYLYEGDAEWKNIFTHTLHAMFEGGMYDRVEGGFFRYSTTRDWSIPHYEKMLEDNARLLSVLLTAHKLTADEFFADAARDVLRYLKDNLFMPEKNCWAGTQNADEEYYQLPMEERLQKTKPRLDRTIYVSWNALLVRSLLQAEVVLQEPGWGDLALTTLQMLQDYCYSEEKGMAHYLGGEEDGGKIWGLLEDQAAMGAALTAAYQHTGEASRLNLSRELAAHCLETLSADGGALSDRPLTEEGLGKLSQPVYDLQNNALCARWFVELASLTGEEAYLEKAADIVHAFMDRYQRHTLFSSALALAALGVRERGVVIDVVGRKGDPRLVPLHRTALAAVVPPKVVRLFTPETAGEAGHEEYAAAEQASAFGCMGRHCFEPATDPEALQQVIDKMIAERRAHVLFTIKESSKV